MALHTGANIICSNKNKTMKKNTVLVKGTDHPKLTIHSFIIYSPPMESLVQSLDSKTALQHSPQQLK